MNKYIIYCLVLGVFLISGGVVVQVVNNSLVNLAVAIVGGGIVSIIASGVIFLYTNKGFWQKRSIEASTNAILSTVALLFILGLVNFLGLRYSLKFDLTETQLYTLSPQSQELVKNLSQPLTVYLFESQPNESDRKLLKDYARENDRFQYQFVDPQVNINLAKKFNVTRIGDVYVEYGDKKQLVQILSPENRLSEVKLTNTIAKIQQTEQPIIYILQGHGEPSLEQGQISISQAVTTLSDKGYIVNPITLATSPLIPPDANVLIISNPQQELLEGEIQIIDKYVEEGGNLLVMYNAETQVNLDRVLSKWGIKFDNRLVIDSSGSGELLGLGASVTIVVEYGNHPITQDFKNGITIFPWTRAIIADLKTNITPTPILITSSQSWAESNPEGETVEFNPDSDLPGPLNIGIALTRKNPYSNTLETQDKTLEPNKEKSEVKPNLPTLEEQINGLPNPPSMKTPEEKNLTSAKKEMPPETRMVAIGNANFATDGWFGQQLNSDLFLNTVAWLSNQDNSILSISPKEPTNRRINLNGLQTSLINWLALIIIPGLGFLASIVTWWRRSR